MDGCYIREFCLDNAWKALEMGNSELRVVVLPEKGADIYSIEYKRRDNLDILWKAPWNPVLPGTIYSPDSMRQWMDAYAGGWQLLFPNAGAESTYKGTVYGFHGEASLAPWCWRIEQWNKSGISILFWLRLPHVPYQLERWIMMDNGVPEIRIREKISNLGEEEMEFEWGHHIVFGEPFLSEHCMLHIPAGKICTGRSNNSRLPQGEHVWPMVNDGLDFRVVFGKKAGTSDFGILEDLAEGCYELENKKMNLKVRVVWDLEELPFVWLWQEFNGSPGYPFYRQCYVMGIEPCSTNTEAGLSDSVSRGKAVRIKPHDFRELNLSLRLMETI